MAITISTRSSFEDRGVIKPNIDDRLDFLEPTDLPFLSYIGYATDAAGATKGANSLKFPCTQQRHNWLNDSLVPSVSSLAAAFTSGDATATVPNGESERFQDDDMIMIDESYYLVTSTDHTANTLTVTVQNSTDANHANGALVYLLGPAKKEGEAASAIEARTTDFGSVENYTQIFEAKVSLTGTEMATERYGISGDPFDYQLNKRLLELGIQLEQAAIYGRRNATYPSANTTARRMGGMAEYVRDGSGTNINNAAGADLDEIRLNDLLEDIWADGGKPDAIMVPMRQKRMISSFLNPYVRTTRDEGVAGVVVGQYESDAGVLDVILNRWMKKDDLIILTKEYIGIGPLVGNGVSRAFHYFDLPQDGDYRQAMVIGEYVMEVRNATKAHGWIYNLSTS